LGFAEFRREGRLGCPNDYAAFREQLGALLERIHRSRRHHGKRPAQSQSVTEFAALRRLRRDLAAAVDAADYETAAAVRDRLRAEDRLHGP
jgi:protein arginine kinase activator